MTEKHDEIWLIGQKDSTELDTPLPSNVHLLRKIYYQHDNNKQSFGKSIDKISDKMYLDLERMGFRPMSKNSTQVKMKRLLNEHENLKYNRNCNKKWFLFFMETFDVRSEFRIDPEEEEALRELCLFFALVYVPAWLAAPIAADAPVNDLNLIKTLTKYKAINPVIATRALNKLANHLWYLSPEIVPIWLFSDLISNHEKRKLQSALLAYGEGDWGNRTIRPTLSKSLLKSNLWVLVDESSICSLKLLHSEANVVLSTDPTMWGTCEVYCQMKKTIDSLGVVNDLAERSIKLVSDLSQSPLTRDEEEFQRVIQVVEHNRKQFPIVSNSQASNI